MMIAAFKGLLSLAFPDEWLDGGELRSSIAGKFGYVLFPNGKGFEINIHLDPRALTAREIQTINWLGMGYPFESPAITRVFGCASPTVDLAAVPAAPTNGLEPADLRRAPTGRKQVEEWLAAMGLTPSVEDWAAAQELSPVFTLSKHLEVLGATDEQVAAVSTG